MIFGDINPDDFGIIALDGIDGALSAYRAAGGVVDYCVVRVASTVEQARGHRVAAATLIDQAGRSHTNLARRSGSQRTIAYDIDSAGAAFELITPQQMMGPFYDWPSGQLKSAWVDGVRSGVQPNGPITHGYADAFSDPPHPLRASIEKASAWFRAINLGTFGGLDQDLIVYRWSTDWSDYFEPGHEWWGSHCWTVQQTGSQLVAAIGASSTD